jgi:hypothetical protein
MIRDGIASATRNVVAGYEGSWAECVMTRFLDKLAESFLHPQLGRLNPCKATLPDDDAAAHTHMIRRAALALAARA